MFTLVFDEGGLSGLITPQDDPNAAVLAERYKFLRRLTPVLQEFHKQIREAGEEIDD